MNRVAESKIVVQSKVQPSLLRELNQRQVLAALQRHGPLSRAEIARRTGISGPTVTRVVSDLLESQLLEEQQPPSVAAVGRPGKLVRLATKQVGVLGCVIGARSCEIVSAGLDGVVDDLQVRRFETPADYAQLVTRCVEQAREMMRARGGTVLGLGISMPGLLDRRTGKSIMSPNLHQFDGRNLGHDLRERLQLDTLVLQECHALCLAEQTFGAAQGVADFALLDISEGLGLGVVHGGRILRGHGGLAGELGHTTVVIDGRRCGCGNRGCLETEATDAALLTAVAELTGRRMSFQDLQQLPQSAALQRVIGRVFDYLSVGLATVVNVFNPHKLFVYGRLFDLHAAAFDDVVARARRRALAPSFADCEVVRACGNKRQGAVAAAIHGATHGWTQDQF